jgi:hypothetical protein
MLEAHKAITMMGIAGAQKLPGWWRLTVVVCAQCTYTTFFTPNLAELLQRVPGAYTSTAPPA